MNDKKKKLKDKTWPECSRCGESHPLNRCGLCGKESMKCPCYDCLEKLVMDLMPGMIGERIISNRVTRKQPSDRVTLVKPAIVKPPKRKQDKDS